MKQLMILLLGTFLLTGCVRYSGGEPVEPEEDKPKTENKEEVKKEEKTKVPSYKITEERTDEKAGTWYVTVSTKETSEKGLKSLAQSFIQHAKDKNKELSSFFLFVTKENSSSAHIAIAKAALDQKGLAQTGLREIDKIDFEYLPENISEEIQIEKSESDLSANDVLQAFKDANLQVPDDRDNTKKNCDTLGCSQLITTEAVSIYQWPTEKKAEEVKEYYDYQKGTFTIRFNDEVPSEDDYKKALDSLH